MIRQYITACDIWLDLLLESIFFLLVADGVFDLGDLETHRVSSGPDGRPSQSECLISYFWQALLRAELLFFVFLLALPPLVYYTTLPHDRGIPFARLLLLRLFYLLPPLIRLAYTWPLSCFRCRENPCHASGEIWLPLIFLSRFPSLTFETDTSQLFHHWSSQRWKKKFTLQAPRF